MIKRKNDIEAILAVGKNENSEKGLTIAQAQEVADAFMKKYNGNVGSATGSLVLCGGCGMVSFACSPNVSDASAVDCVITGATGAERGFLIGNV